MRKNLWKLAVAVCLILFHFAHLSADDLIVTNEAEFNSALDNAVDGDRILLAPGNYNGGFFQANLTGVTIQSQFTDNLATITGGNQAIQLSDATRVTIAHMIFQGQTGNGLNIDDGGSFVTPSTDITIRDLTIRDMNASGNNDGIKLSGVTGFTIENVRVTNWGEGGSAVDMVGSHHGLIQNSFFHHDAIGAGGTGVRPKGGSKDIMIRANRVELPGTNGRAIQAGGSTGSQFFRFIDGDSGYEASEIRVEGNVVVNGSSAFSFVNIDGGEVHSNYAHRPDDWFIRILNENPGDSMVDTQNGWLADNLMVFNDTATEFNSAVNVGSETNPETFEFLRNQWYNLADPSSSTPNLPSEETDGTYGVAPDYTIDEAVSWDFDWGMWLVNANEDANVFTLDSPEMYKLAVPGAGAEFDPLAADPFTGNWTFEDLPSGTIDLSEFSQAYLVAIPEPTGPMLFVLMSIPLSMRRIRRSRPPSDNQISRV